MLRERGQAESGTFEECKELGYDWSLEGEEGRVEKLEGEVGGARHSYLQ